MSGNMAKFFPLVCTALLALFGSSKACRDLRSNDGVLGGLSDGRAKWISLRDSWGLTGTYQYRLYKTCKNKPTFPDCFLGDNGKGTYCPLTTIAVCVNVHRHHQTLAVKH